MSQETITRKEDNISSVDLRHIKRVEDFRFLTGRAVYTDDIKPNNVCYLGFVRSVYAHALIKKIDLTKARDNAAFITALTGEDLSRLGLGIVYENEMPGVKRTTRHQLAFSKVRYVGEPVVAFLSKDRYSVEDIADEIEVEYEPLTPVIRIEEAQTDKTLIYDEWRTNSILDVKVKRGDAESAIRSAPHIVKGSFGVKRQSGAAMEPRVVIASFDKSNGIYDIFSTLQHAHRIRQYLSSELKISTEKFHIRVPDVGGGFGAKGAQSYAAPCIACILAERTGLTVKWVSTRTEDLLETAQARDEYCDVELACDSGARIVALRATITSDGGVGGTLKAQAMLSGRLMPGAYKIPNLEIRSITWATNKTPGGPIRGAGRPEGIYFMELIMDKMARRLHLDPIGFRRLNAIPSSEFPYDNGAGMIYDSANFPKLLDSLKSEYEALNRWKREVTRTDSDLLAGVNVALIVEDTGAQLSETAKVVISPKEKLLYVYTGSSPHGQGLETTLAILASEELDIPIERIKVKWGDSNDLPTSVGTFGSRSIVTGGSAVVEACRKLREEIVSEAARIFNAQKEHIVLEGEKLRISVSTKSEPLADLWEFIDQSGKKFETYTNFALKAVPYASGAHLCGVTVDRETGKVKIQRYIVADDCGRVVNEIIVDGQLHGGVVHGIGDMFLSEIPYDESGAPLATSFLDYLIPTSLDVPDIGTIHVETPSTLSLNGAKGVGESGTIGAFPAVISAINDALVGISEIDIAPATPERVYKVLRKN
ncbi:MAG: xanthine dehydrogenase family protein molybdopterin-binding subunit [Nitrososphaerota archaeon]|nr:xanthine dehydrogenase family protein molybdopterin-binding subunit [Nitrososphaerota archaeon]